MRPQRVSILSLKAVTHPVTRMPVMMYTACSRFTPIIRLGWSFLTKSCQCSRRARWTEFMTRNLSSKPQPPRVLVNQGALRNARYLYPVIGYRPIEGLELKLAYLMAFSAAGAIDLFQSGINGGYNLGLTANRPRQRIWGKNSVLASATRSMLQMASRQP